LITPDIATIFASVVKEKQAVTSEVPVKTVAVSRQP
jgi:hypothetical protein